MRGHVGPARLLLERGADPNQARSDSGITALIMASETGHEQLARLFVTHGADTNLSSFDGASPLFYAAQHGHLSVARLLLGWGANPNRAMDFGTGVVTAEGYGEVMERGSTPLIAAAYGAHAELVRLLVSHGTISNRRTASGNSAEKFVRLRWNHETLANWLGIVAGWPSVMVAVACRCPAAAVAALRLGRMDPGSCTPAKLRAVASHKTDLRWPGSPAVCPDTTAFAREVVVAWA